MSRRFLQSIIDRPKLPSRDIPYYVRDKALGRLSDENQLRFMWQFRKDIIRKRFATFGRNSGLKPGIAWPCKEELAHMKEYEAKFELTIDQMQKKLSEQKRLENEKRAKREKEIIENLKNLPKQKAEFWTKYHKLYKDIEEESQKKDKLIQEVREYLGYDIDPKDHRFEEALAKKDEEAKQAMRAARKAEKQKQAMEMLQALVSEALEKEKSESKSASGKKESNPTTETTPVSSQK